VLPEWSTGSSPVVLIGPSQLSAYSPQVPFDRKKLRVERFSAEVAYVAAYRYWSLRGVLAERWAYGPVFGAYREGPDQTYLSPPSTDDDGRIEAAYGLRGAAVFAEGASRTGEAPKVAETWFTDVYAAYDPPKTTAVQVTLTALYPIKNPKRVAAALRERNYRDEELRKVVPARFGNFFAGIELAAVEGPERFTLSAGVIEPRLVPDPMFYWPDPDGTRDQQSWMLMKLSTSHRDDAGLAEPVTRVKELTDMAFEDLSTAVRTVLPAVVD
jgi:hypothetical protein